MLKEALDRVKDQMGPCGIACSNCEMGNGSIAEAAINLKEYLEKFGVPTWAGQVPGGSEIDFDSLYKGLDWIQTYTQCLGCEQGGGPPDCAIRLCANERGNEICSYCSELESCEKFDWLGEKTSKQLKKTLIEAKGKTKQELLTKL